MMTQGDTKPSEQGSILPSPQPRLVQASREINRGLVWKIGYGQRIPLAAAILLLPGLAKVRTE